MAIRFALASFWLLSSLLTAVGAAFSLYSFIVRQAAANPAAWQHHGIYQVRPLKSLPDRSPLGITQSHVRSDWREPCMLARPGHPRNRGLTPLRRSSRP